jgi:hypothetical protein
LDPLVDLISPSQPQLSLRVGVRESRPLTLTAVPAKHSCHSQLLLQWRGRESESYTSSGEESVIEGGLALNLGTTS